MTQQSRLQLVLVATACAAGLSVIGGASSPPVPAQAGPRGAPPQADALPPAVARVLAEIEWRPSRHEYGSACVRIAGRRVIYIDPADLPDNEPVRKADLILITHSHPDHFSPQVLERLRTPATRIVTIAECADRLRDWPDVTRVAPGQRLTIEDVAVEAVPAYSTASRAHPRENGWVGFVLTVDGVRLYHSGDTSCTPEMAALKDIDIAFFDIRPPYQMSGAQVVEAMQALKPRVAIPIHWLEAERAEVDYLVAHAPAWTRVALCRAGRCE